MEAKPNNVVEQLKSVWFILAFVVGMVVWYANVNSVQESHDQRLTALEAEVGSNGVVLVEIKERLIGIETTLEFIKNKE